jgi:hypothetical protein
LTHGIELRSSSYCSVVDFLTAEVMVVADDALTLVALGTMPLPLEALWGSDDFLGTEAWEEERE